MSAAAEHCRRVKLPDGATLNVFDRGAGPVILLVHGFPLDHRMWQEQFAALSEGHRVIAPDLRGFGASEVHPFQVTMRQYADDLAAVLDALDIREPLTLIGLSMGGYIAFEFVRNHADRVGRLALCDTRAAPDTVEAAAARHKMADEVTVTGAESVAQAMLPKLLAPETQASKLELVGAMHDVIVANSPSGIAAAQRGMAERADSRSLLPSIRVPTLVLVGEHDAISPPAEMRELADQIPGAKFVVVPHAGHLAPLENPAFVNRELLAFLGATESRTTTAS